MRTVLYAILLVACAAPAAAQRVRGAAIDGDGAPVQGVVVEIRSPAGEALAPLHTDSAGLFELMLPAPGRYELSASHLGYVSIGPAELIADRGRELEIVLRMSTEALVLDPIEVTIRRAARTTLDEVHNRIEWVRRLGMGRTLTRDEIEVRAAPTIHALVGQMSPRVRTVAPITGHDTILLSAPTDVEGVCIPTIYLDGMRAPDLVERNMIRPEHLEAVELYIGAAEIPAQYNTGTTAECGTVLFWTRRGADPGSPQITWKRFALAGAIVGLILLVGIP